MPKTKRNFLLLFLSSLLMSSIAAIQWRTKSALCKSPDDNTPLPPPPAPVVCTDGYVKIGTSYLYTKCVDCIPGPESTFESKLNSERVFGSGGWTFGATVGPNIANVDNLLGLTYNSSTKVYSFTKTSTKQYEIVIILKAGSCGTLYYLPCTPFTQIQQVFFSTKGVDKGTSQELEQMTYYYKQCGGTVPPERCSLANFPIPAKTGTYDCSAFATVTSLINGVPANSEGCLGSYMGNLDHGLCKTDDKDNVCLNRVLNTSPNLLCGYEWCCIEKVDVTGKMNYGSNLGIIASTGRTGTFDINPVFKGPFILTMKAGNFFSAYLLLSGNKGSWITNFADLSHSTLWAPCVAGMTNN